MRVRRCLPCGQRRCRVARRIFGVSQKETGPGTFCPSGYLTGAPENGPSRVSTPGMELRTIPQTEHALSRHSFHIIRAQQRQHQARLPAIAFRGEHPACAPGLPSPQNPGFSPFPPPPYSPAIPQGERRALPAPAQGSRPLRIPFGEPAPVFPVSPSPKRRRRTAPARGPSAVYALCRRNRNETKRPCPLLVGHGRVNTEPTALAGDTVALPASTCRRPCRLRRGWQPVPARGCP